MDTGHKINWETFLDNYFVSFKPSVDKKEYKNGHTIYYSVDDIYVWCDLDTSKTKIKKLEFGRLFCLNNCEKEPNWIKGVFKNGPNRNVEFLQTSFDGEEGKQYEINLNDKNKIAVEEFLQIPSKFGWLEDEYLIIPDINYKVIVLLDNQKWSITLKDIGEQDIPMLSDSLDQWLRVKIADAFWNNKKRTVKRIVVPPMTHKTTTV